MQALPLLRNHSVSTSYHLAIIILSDHISRPDNTRWRFSPNYYDHVRESYFPRGIESTQRLGTQILHPIKTSTDNYKELSLSSRPLASDFIRSTNSYTIKVFKGKLGILDSDSGPDGRTTYLAPGREGVVLECISF